MIDQQYPITPPPELVERWRSQWVGADTTLASYIAKQAAQWGADQELEACCEWMKLEGHEHEHTALRIARRPKPPTLKEQALELVRRIEKAESPWAMSELDTIRRALEQLNEN